MASTPSSSALSAVLRCRGNIWARNPPTRRPAAPASSLGRAGREERSRSRPWEALLREARALLGGRPAARARRAVGNHSGETNKSCRSEPSQTSYGEAPARQLTSRLPGSDVISKIKEVTHNTCAAHVRRIALVRDVGELSPRVVLVSVAPARLSGLAGPGPPFVTTGWSTLKSGCSSLTAPVSRFVLARLGELRHYGSPDGPQRLRSRRGGDAARSDAAQENGRTHAPSGLNPSPSLSQRASEDRPD